MSETQTSEKLGAVNPDHVRDVARRVRIEVLRHTVENAGGYLSQACSASIALATLFGGLMRIEPSTAPRIPPRFPGVPTPGDPLSTGGGYIGPRRPDLDRLVFSPAHYALILYATLIEFDRLAPEALDAFNADGSTVEMIGAEHSPGFETTSGSLAQSLSTAGGIALARRLKGESGHVWVYMSDGEMQEGQTWEAVAALAHHHVDNLTVLVDVNGQQCDGPVDSVMTIDPLAERLRAFGATAIDVDGHDPEALVEAATSGRVGGKPTFLLCRTDPCYDLPFLKERAPLLHYVRFSSDAERQQYAQHLAELTS